MVAQKDLSLNGRIKAAAVVVSGICFTPLLLMSSVGKAFAETHPQPSAQARIGLLSLPLFTQCPSVGGATGCNVLITANPDGTFSQQVDPAQPPYDGIDDQLVGFLNNSTNVISGLNLVGSASNQPIFGFDGDGLCNPSGFSQLCSYGPTGYEGPNTSFTNISLNQQSGTVVFNGGVQPGNSIYFSLEAPASANGIPGITPITPTNVPEPGMAGGLLVMGAGWLLKRKMN